MESNTAASSQKKKINKSKLKKTIKNVLCRPDPIFWPAVTDEQKQMVEIALGKHKVLIPEFQKPLWKDLKSVSKEQRPKPPKTEKVRGLLFGLSECNIAIQHGQCSGIILEAAVNPRTIVQPLLESCSDKRVPVICVGGLRNTAKTNFGIPTSCLGVQKDCLTDISGFIHELGFKKLPEARNVAPKALDVEKTDNKKNSYPMDTQEPIQFEYLYRTNKKIRVFVPPSGHIMKKETNEFKGQDFIEFSDIKEGRKKSFKKMIVKKISNNTSKGEVKKIANF